MFEPYDDVFPVASVVGVVDAFDVFVVVGLLFVGFAYVVVCGFITSLLNTTGTLLVTS